MKRNLLKIYTKKQLSEIFKTYGKPHTDYKFMKVTRRFEVDPLYGRLSIRKNKGNYLKQVHETTQ